MMKRIYLLFLFLTCLIVSNAQEISFGPLHSADSPRKEWLLPGDTIWQDGKKMIYNGKPVKNSTILKGVETNTDTKNLNDDGLSDNPVGYLGYGYGYGGLHKGLNFSVDLSAFATFGKHVPHHGGFTQTINATYLTPLTKDGKLWMAAGGYLNNINWGGDSYRDAGLYAMVGYRFNEHWEAYAYGQLSLNNNYQSFYSPYYGMGYGPYAYGRYGFMPGMWGRGVMPGGYGMGAAGANVVGAGVKYTNKNFSIGFNVEGVWYDNKTPAYFGKYNYPVPPKPEENSKR